MPPAPLSLSRLLLCGGAIVTLSMGIRHGLGMWLLPITQEMGWSRQDFSLALAVQNLTWGLVGVFAGMLADRFGALRVLMAGGVVHTLGLIGMAYAPTPLLFTASAGVLIGVAQAGTTYAIVYGVIGRNTAPEQRSWAMGIAAAAGSFGQFLMVPAEAFLISQFGWQQALGMLGVATLLIIPLARGLREPGFAGNAQVRREQSALQALLEALGYRSFQLLTAGYFVCGFQLAFVGVHMPSYLKDQGLPLPVASLALALIGLFNVFGTYAVGVFGQRMRKPRILSCIYLARSACITLFVLLPVTPMSVYVFASLMGLLWLSTVPATNATVAQMLGVAHLSMLSGLVFLSHQVGSFLGVWLGGVLYDSTGSYSMAWLTTIVLGIAAALLNLPVDEHPIRRSTLPAGAAAGH